MEGSSDIVNSIRNMIGDDLKNAVLMKKAILEAITDSQDRISLGSLTLLHKEGIVWFPIVLQELTLRKGVEYVTESFANDLLYALSMETFILVVRCSFCVKELKHKELSLMILNLFWTKYWNEPRELNIFRNTILSFALHRELLKEMSSHLIRRFITEESEGVLRGEAKKSEDCLALKIDKNSLSWTTELLSSLMAPFQIEEIGAMVERLLRSKTTISMDNFLAFTHAFLQISTEAEKVLHYLTRRLISDSLETGDEALFLKSLAVVRLACKDEDCKSFFESYSGWYERSFNSEHNTIANSGRKCLQLLKFLTKIMPYEDMNCLRSHLGRHPFVPIALKQNLLDYNNLARTRFSDLQQDHEKAISNKSSINMENVSEETKQEVYNALDEFQKTSKISHWVMQLCIFKKQYFTSQFVPWLQCEKCYPDQETRLKFIDEMVKRKKMQRCS